jgi:hypothetical protein
MALNTFMERGAIYRDNHQRVGAALAALFPDGIEVSSADDHERLALITLIMVKLTRYATEWNNGGHKDSIHDCIVYSAMLEARTADNQRQHGQRRDTEAIDRPAHFDLAQPVAPFLGKAK